MFDASERERSIAENLEAERRILSDIQRLTGIALPRLQWIANVNESERERLQPLAAELLQGEGNPVVRSTLYGVFGARVREDYFERLISWHRQETQDRGLEVLERCLIVHSGKTNGQRLYDYLLSTPARIKLDGLRFLVRRSKSDGRLLERIREAYSNCGYDLEVLSVIANRFEADFTVIVGNGASKDRLTGRQCTALVFYQLPVNEMFYRRPSLVPYYARILTSSTAREAHLAPALRRLCDEHRFRADIASGLVAALAALRKHECVPLSVAVDESARLTRAIILSRWLVDDGKPVRATVSMRPRTANCRPRGGPAEGYWFGLIESPIPPPWNLFPKRLLPADDPARYVRPD